MKNTNPLLLKTNNKPVKLSYQHKPPYLQLFLKKNLAYSFLARKLNASSKLYSVFEFLMPVKIFFCKNNNIIT